jgi:hypothetical protein
MLSLENAWVMDHSPYAVLLLLVGGGGGVGGTSA